MNIKLTSMRWVLNFEVGSRLRSPDVRRSTFDVPSYFSLHDTVCRTQRRKNAFSASGRIHCDRKTVLFSRFYTLGFKDRQFCRKGERRNKSSEFNLNICNMLLYIHASCQSWSGTFARMTGDAPMSLF